MQPLHSATLIVWTTSSSDIAGLDFTRWREEGHSHVLGKAAEWGVSKSVKTEPYDQLSEEALHVLVRGRTPVRTPAMLLDQTKARK